MFSSRTLRVKLKLGPSDIMVIAIVFTRFEMTKFSLWTCVCLLCYVCADIRTGHYHKSAVEENRKPLVCLASVCRLLCAVNCTSIPNCTLFCTGDKENCYTTTMDMTAVSDRKQQINKKHNDSPDLPTPAKPTNTGDHSTTKCRGHIGLYTASLNGKLSLVQGILFQGLEDINCRGYKGRTPVMAAARNEHFQVFDFLVSQGCDLAAVDGHKDNVLHIACMGGNTDIVKKLIVSLKIDIESKGNIGVTPVMSAVWEGQMAVFDFLVNQGCDLSAVNDNKDNVLHIACRGGNAKLVRLLIDKWKFDVNCRGCFERTPLITAAKEGLTNIFDLLLSMGANVNLVDKFKENILHAACSANRVGMVNYILKLNISGIDIESKGYNGRTPVMAAARKGYKETVQFLMKKGCNLTVLDNDANTILHMASERGHVDMVKYLLTLGTVKKDARNKSGRTPVQLAESEGHDAVVALLRRKRGK